MGVLRLPAVFQKTSSNALQSAQVLDVVGVNDTTATSGRAPFVLS